MGRHQFEKLALALMLGAVLCNPGCSREAPQPAPAPAASAPAQAVSAPATAAAASSRFTGAALRFGGNHQVEIANSQSLIDFARPFTVEFWIRPHPGASEFPILGNLVATDRPAEASADAPHAGWRLTCSSPAGRLAPTLFGSLQEKIDAPLRGFEWRHLAFCGDGKSVKVFTDGKLLGEQTIPAMEPSANPSNSYLGRITPAEPGSANPAATPWNFDLQGVRISSTARYAAAFEPQSFWENDDQTLLLFNFSQDQGNTVRDFSGHGRNGAIRGARWIELADERLPISDGPFALRFLGSTHARIPYPEAEPTESKNWITEMWCRWKLGEREMEWLGPFRNEPPQPGNWALRARSKGKVTQLKIAHVGRDGKWHESDSGEAPADDQWHQLAVQTAPDGVVQAWVDGKLAVQTKCDGSSDARDLKMCLGPQVGEWDETVYFDVRGFRWTNASPSAPPADFSHPMLIGNPQTEVLLDFSEPTAPMLRDLSEHQRHAEGLAAKWFDSRTGAKVVETIAFHGHFAPPSRPIYSSSMRSTVMSIPAGASGEKESTVAFASPLKSLNDTPRDDVYVHEIARQALLLSFREALGWTTRDAALGETWDNATPQPANRFALQTEHTFGSKFRVKLERTDLQNVEVIWQSEINLPLMAPAALLAILEHAEDWSRNEFPDALKKTGVVGEAKAAGDAQTPASIEKALGDVDFIAQFAALRQLHGLAREHGNSPALTGALARGYANLGLLTEHHWNNGHKALKSRGLLYAQRLAADPSTQSLGLYHRGYALAFAGFHAQALNDLKTAATAKQKSPDWAPMIEGYCRFDADAIGQAVQEKDTASLGALLRFIAAEQPGAIQLMLKQADEALESGAASPRLFDSMLDIFTLGNLHKVTALAPTAFTASLRTQLPAIADLPPSVVESLAALDGDPAHEAGLVRALRAAGDADEHELSWKILSQLIAENYLVLVANRASFMRFEWGVPVEEFLQQATPLIQDHPWRPLIEFIAHGGALAPGQDPPFSPERGFPVMPWQFRPRLNRLTRQPDGLFPSVDGGNGLQTSLDEDYRDLLALENWHRSPRTKFGMADRLQEVSPFAPAVGRTRVLYALQNEVVDTTAVEKEFGQHSSVLDAMIASPNTGNEDRIRLLKKRIALSADHWAFKSLAGLQEAAGDIEGWKGTLESFLEQPETGLEHARVRVDLATYYMKRKEWDKAQPLVEEAAETYAEWAMLAAVACYEGKGDLDQAELWMQRIAERYGREAEYRDWLKRHNRPDAAPDARPST